LVNHIRGNSVDVDKARNNQGWVEANGWPKRVVDGCKNLIEKIEFINNNEGTKEANNEINSLLESLGGKYTLKNNKPNKVFNDMLYKFKQEGVKEHVLTGKFHRLGTGKFKPIQDAFEELIKADQSIILSKSGETDEPVTVDVRRVIRYPTSLHGKSGLKVTEFPLERLDPENKNKFDPLTEAVVFGKGKSVKLEIMIDDGNIRIKDKEYELENGKIIEVNEDVASFLILKNWARINKG